MLALWLRWRGTYGLVERRYRMAMGVKVHILPSIRAARGAALRFTAIDAMLGVKAQRELGSEPRVDAVMSEETLTGLLDLVRRIFLPDPVANYIARLVDATHPGQSAAARGIRYGASPRGAQALVLGAKVRALMEGRFNVSVEDLRALAVPALRHRVILNFEGEAEGVDNDTLISQIVESAEAIATQGKEAFLR